jgi:endonuclease YncB( thermonuclease family)
MKQLIKILFITIFYLFTFNVNAQIFFKNTTVTPITYEAKILAVHDGDSYKIKQDTNIYWVRLIGLDAPEVYSPYVLGTQPFGRESGNFVRDSLKSKTVTVVEYGVDEHHRPLVTIKYDNNDLTEVLIKNGYAWHFKSPVFSSKYNKHLSSLHSEARKNKIGLWIDKNPISPWTFKKKMSILK